MPLNIRQILQDHQNQNYELHREHINPQFARVLKTIGFDRVYTKALGPHRWDAQGNKYLDFQGGYAVHNVGRNHPAVKKALIDFLQEDYPTMVAFDAPLFLAQGRDDELVVPGDTEQFARHQAALGISVTFHEIPFADHGTVAYLALPAMLRWLDRVEAERAHTPP